MEKQHDTKLVEMALQMAVQNRHLAAGLSHHSERGSEYARSRYQALLQLHDMQASMSGKGDCY